MYYVFFRNHSGFLDLIFFYCSGCLLYERNDKERKFADLGGQEWSGGVCAPRLDRDFGLLRQDSTRGATSRLRETTDERTGPLAFGYSKHRTLRGTLPTKSPHPDQDLSDIRPQYRGPAAFPPPNPNSQPVSFLISSSSSSRSNVEARDPITVGGGCSSGSGCARSYGGEREGGREGPGVKKEEGTVSSAARGGKPGVARGGGQPDSSQSGARPRPAQAPTSELGARARNESAPWLRESKGRQTPPPEPQLPPALKGRRHSGAGDHS